jgi:hypothetical protein
MNNACSGCKVKVYTNIIDGSCEEFRLLSCDRKDCPSWIDTAECYSWNIAKHLKEGKFIIQLDLQCYTSYSYDCGPEGDCIWDYEVKRKLRWGRWL